MAEQRAERTKRGVPATYSGGDPSLCNAATRAGKPCRALALPGSGRCKWHGGASTGPKTPAGKARCTRNLVKARAKLARLRADARRWAESRDSASTTPACE